MPDRSGRCVVVIGGTAGIGKAIALALAGAGANVVATSRSREHTAALADRIERMGRRTLRIVSDVGNRESLQHLHDQSIAAFGHTDILVNCAGITQRVPTLECSD